VAFPFRIPIGKWIETIVLWLTDHFSGVFDSIAAVVGFMLVQIDHFFNRVPWPIMLLALALLAWFVSGWRVGVLVGVSLFFLGCLDLWALGMSTLALVAMAVFISVLVGLPVGIVAARNERVSAFLNPILDGMQTIPRIMTGVNQTVMMSLSMVVVAAMIGAGGLGYKILYSIQRIDLAVGVEAGLGILIIAIVLDRILQGITRRQKKALMRE
jgi:glycine betaine/proline transport system permease protein